jgi:uncharacterized protein YdaU (DUF1376 family)
MHYYQFNIGDYKSHTEHLSEMEDLAYRRLLDFYYLHEKPIENDINKISRQIRMRTHCDCIANVLREFFVLKDDSWFSKRADEEIARMNEKSSKASRSANARWSKKTNKNNKLSSDANALRTQSEGNATHNTIHNTHNTIHNKEKATVVATPEGVSDDLWNDFKAIRKAKRSPVTQRVIDGLNVEAKKAGWTLEEVVKECVLRGWQSFKADWVKDKNSQPQLSKNAELVQRVGGGLTRGLIGGTNVKLLGK